MLNGATVLLAEDQTFIALDLSFAVEDAGGEVIGPAARIQEALDLLATRTIAGAILDVDLADGDCSAVLEVVVSRHIPTIVQTGAEWRPALAARFPGLIVHIKPCRAAALVTELEIMIQNAGGGSG